MKKAGGFGFRRKALRIRLELAGRILCEGTTDTMPPEVAIGRAPDCGWRIPPTDKTASNHHARLRARRGKWWVEDTGSRNGMYSKGEKVSEWCLAPGDQISIGDCVLSVERVEEKDAERAEHHRLEQLNGADAGRMIDLDRETSIIGSAPTCDIVCDDNLVSHRHAGIECKRDGSCWVKDLKSRNGTRVNRLPLKANERMLRDGDILSVAYVDFRFWDKNTTHVPSHIRLRAAVAAMTVLVCLAGWFFWNALNPSAGYLLGQARKKADRGDFRSALALVEQAKTARQHAQRRADIQGREHEIRMKQDTALRWEQMQEALEAEHWRDAKDTQMKDLQWAESAAGHRVRAERLQDLVEAFIGMRDAMVSATDGDAAVEALERTTATWSNALAAASGTPAMLEPVWKHSFRSARTEEHEAQDVQSAHENVWRVLKESGEEIKAEIDRALGSRKEMLASLKALDGPMPDPEKTGGGPTADEAKAITGHAAQICRDAMGVAYTNNLIRKKEQEVAWNKGESYLHLRYSPIAENLYAKLQFALNDLVAAEETVLSNVDRLAKREAKKGDKESQTEALEGELAFPHRTDNWILLRYQAVLAGANSNLCTKVAGELDFKLKDLLAAGMETASDTPPSIARLEQLDLKRDIFTFVDWLQPPPNRATVDWGEKSIPGCPYDEILGCKYAGKLLDSPAESTRMLDWLGKTREEVVKEDVFWPLARQARDEYACLDALLDQVKRSPLLALRIRGDAPESHLKALCQRAEALERERDGLLAAWLDAAEDLDGREAVAVRALWLMVSPEWNDGVYATAHGEYDSLRNEHRQAAKDTKGYASYLKACLPDDVFIEKWIRYHYAKAKEEMEGL